LIFDGVPEDVHALGQLCLPEKSLPAQRWIERFYNERAGNLYAVTEFPHLALDGRAPEPGERVLIFDGVPEESHRHR
jgi:hypothetical protein